MHLLRFQICFGETGISRCAENHVFGKEVKVTWHEIAPNTVANATKIIVLATKMQKLVAKLATTTLLVLYILP